MNSTEVKIIGTYLPSSEPPSKAGYYSVRLSWGGPYLCRYGDGKWAHGAGLTSHNAEGCKKETDYNFQRGVCMNPSEVDDLHWCEVDLGLVPELFDL